MDPSEKRKIKIYIETLGCPKNENDSEVAAGILTEAGYDVIDRKEAGDGAQVIIVNTCGFINDAKKESVDSILAWAGEDKILVISGCLSQRYGEELFKEIPEAKCVVGVDQYEDLPKFLEKIIRDPDLRILETDGYNSETCSEHLKRRVLPVGAYSTTLKISEGCNNRCAYCVIPSIRGPYRSRRIENITCEAEELVSKGIKELILVAQDVTAYGMDIYGEYALHRLLKELCRIKDLKWIRLMYCYEDRMTDDLIDVIAKEDKICKYIDLPIQHCSDAILSAMGRRSTEASIRGTVEKLRERIPDIRIRTTLITGFPGEKEKDFEELMSFVEEMEFDRLGVFAYSQEEGTEAGEMDDQIPLEIREERRDSIMKIQMDISLKKNMGMTGKTVEVLLEEKEETGIWSGRTAYDAPDIDNGVLVATNRPHSPGDMIMVKITEGMDYDLMGEEV